MASIVEPADPQGTATGGGGQVSINNVLLDFNPNTCTWLAAQDFIECAGHLVVGADDLVIFT